MKEIDYYIPSRIPSEFECFEQPPRQLAVGSQGKLGALRISLRRDGERTVIGDLFSRIPLQVLRALYIDERLPGMAFIYIMSPSGGIVQGDRLRIDISVGREAMVHFTTQSATKIYRMNRNYATQILNLEADEGSYVEFIPDMIIPYVNSRFYQEVNLKVHDEATVIYSEMIAPGRAARGESFRYDIIYSRIEARNQDGRLRFMDTVILKPKSSNLRSLGVLGGYDFLGNLYLLGGDVNHEDLSSRIQGMLRMMGGDAVGGCGVLPDGDGVIVRVLSGASSTLREAMRTVWSMIREEILGVPACRVRKY